MISYAIIELKLFEVHYIIQGIKNYIDLLSYDGLYTIFKLKVIII